MAIDFLLVSHFITGKIMKPCMISPKSPSTTALGGTCASSAYAVVVVVEGKGGKTA